MGGFYNSVARLAGEGAEKIASTFGAKAAPEIGEAIESGVYKKLLQPARSFEDHPYAARIYQDYHNEYKPRVEKYKSIGTQQASAFPTGHPNAPSIGDITKQAHKRAALEVFGPNRVRIQSMLKNVEATQGKNRADVLADHFNILFQEEARTSGPNRMSQFDADMRGGYGKKQTSAEGIETPTSPYKGKSEEGWERNIGRIRATLAYKAAPIHMANTLLNVATSDGGIALLKTMNQIWNPSNRAGAEAQLLTSNAISEMWLNPYKEKLAFDASKIKQYAPGGVGEFIHKNMFIPGMSNVRYESIMMGAQAGKTMAEEAAAHLAQGNKKFALPALRELGLDPAKLAAQNYQMLPDDIEKAYYHGANNRVFLDPYDKTPTFWRQSPLWRSMKAFTGYVSSQGAFERRTLVRQYKQGDFIGIARNIALKSMVYPLVGSTIYEVDRLASGEDWDDPAGHLGSRLEATPAGMIYDAVAGKERSASAAKTALNTLDMIAKLATFGNGAGYLRGASRASLAQHVLPPEANVAIQLGQDAMKATHYDANHKKAADPLMRDILSDIPSLGLGSMASHKLVPTRAEESRNNPKKFRRTKPKADSWNPFNSTSGINDY